MVVHVEHGAVSEAPRGAGRAGGSSSSGGARVSGAVEVRGLGVLCNCAHEFTIYELTPHGRVLASEAAHVPGLLFARLPTHQPGLAAAAARVWRWELYAQIQRSADVAEHVPPLRLVTRLHDRQPVVENRRVLQERHIEDGFRGGALQL